MTDVQPHMPLTGERTVPEAEIENYWFSDPNPRVGDELISARVC